MMVDWLDDNYQQEVVAGALAAARDSGAHLLCFIGGQLQPAGPGGPRQNAFELIDGESVDALVVLSGALVNTAGAAGLAAFAERYRGLPLISIAARVRGDVPTVSVDNLGGMRRAVTHLVKDHAFRALAFVTGPATNEEAAQRLATFREVLAENGCPLEDSWIVPGDFSQPSGVRAIELLFGERAVKPESVQAIVAANDAMAMGVLAELARRGIRVPGKIAVIGFDDTDDARYTNPPLTSVYQPLREQGREAVRLALAALRGERTADVSLRTELVTRRSCGCFPHEIKPVAATGSPHGFESALLERRQVVLAELARSARGRLGALAANWEVRLVNAFTEGLRGEHERFIQVADDMVRQLCDSGVDMNGFHEVLSVLRRELLPCLSGDAARRALGEALLDEVRRVTATASERREARGRLDALRYGADFVQRAATLVSNFEPSWLQREALPALAALGIRGALVARYVEGGEPFTVDVVATTYDSMSPGQQAKARDLLRSLATRCDGICVTSLFFEQRLLGFAIFDLGARAGFGYEALRGLCSTALEGRRLSERLRATLGPDI